MMSEAIMGALGQSRINWYRVFLLLVTLPIGAVAHTPERAADPIARHGGFAKRVGDYNIEFVVDTQRIQLYISSHGNRGLSTNAAVAELHIMNGNEPIKLQLRPDGSNRLTANWQPPAKESIQAILTLSMHGETVLKRPVLGIPILKIRAGPN